MNVFKRSTARIAAWNLCGYHGITQERLKRQVDGLDDDLQLLETDVHFFGVENPDVIPVREILPGQQFLDGRKDLVIIDVSPEGDL